MLNYAQFKFCNKEDMDLQSFVKTTKENDILFVILSIRFVFMFNKKYFVRM